MECGDSINCYINKKVDIVLSNPPFGLKGIKYDSIHCKNKI